MSGINLEIGHGLPGISVYHYSRTGPMPSNNDQTVEFTIQITCTSSTVARSWFSFGLIYRSGVGLFIRICISSLCAANHYLAGSSIVPDEPVLSLTVLAPLLVNLTESLEYNKKHQPYLEDGP